MHRTALLCAFLFVLHTANAQQWLSEKLAASQVTNQQKTLIYLPAQYSKTQSYPLVIYCHSLSQAGTDVAALYKTGLPHVLKEGFKPSFDFIMLAPQSARYSISPEGIERLIAAAQARWNIDTARIYLTGVDAGGWAANGALTNVSASLAKKIAAVVTLSAATQQVNKQNLDWWAASQTPLWAITGAHDENYTAQNKRLVDALNEKVPNLATLTVRPDAAHDNWNAVYRGAITIDGKSIWDWLYAHDRTQTFSKPHVTANSEMAVATNNSTATTLGATTAFRLYNSLHIEAEKFNGRSGILFQTCRDFAGGAMNSFDAGLGDWISYSVNAPVSGSYTLCFRVACAATGSKFQIKNSSGTVLTTVNVPNTNSWQIWRDLTAVVNLSAGTQTLKLQTASSTGWNLNYFEVVKTPQNAFASYTLRPNSGSSIYLPNSLNLAHLKPGDTLAIPGGAYKVIELGNFKGTADHPLIIQNKGGQVTCNIIRLSNTPEYFKLLGNGTSGVTYGFKIDGGSTTGSCLTAFGTGIEIAYVEGLHSKSGFLIKKNPTADDPKSQYPNYLMDKIYLHHNYLHHITGEGMYIGHTAPDGGQGGNPLLPVRMRNVEISYNKIDQTGWDGIQLSNATTGNKIHHNKVTNFGTLNVYGQQAGIILGGNSQGQIYDNTIKNGTGNGIQNFGFGLNKIYNNTLEKVGRNGTTKGVEGVYCNDIITKSETRPKQQIEAYNNTIHYPMPWGAIRVSGYNQNSLPATMQYNKLLLASVPSNWQKVYFPTYVPNSIVSSNTLISQ